MATPRARSTKPARRRTEQAVYDPLATIGVVLIVSTPAVIVPLALDRFVFGKLLVAAAGIALVWLSRPTGAVDRVVRLTLTALALLLVTATLVCASPVTAFWGRSPRYEGLLTLMLYLICVPTGARNLGPFTAKRTRDAAMVALGVVVVAVAGIAVLETFGARPLSSNLDRPGSLLGNASDQGALAVVYAGPLIVKAFRERSTWWLAAASAAVATVVLSASRGALIGVLVVLLVIAGLSSRAGRRLATGVGALVLVAALAVPFTRDRVLGLSPLAGHTIGGRNRLWAESLALIRDHWLFGVGPDEFSGIIIRYHDRRWYAEVGPAAPPDSPHNWILQILVIGGVGALVALLAVLARGAVLVARALARSTDTPSQRDWTVGVTAGLVGYGVALLFHLSSVGTTVPAALLAGSLLGVARMNSLSKTPGRSALAKATSPVVAAVAIALALVYFLGAVGEIALRRAISNASAGDLLAADRDFRFAAAIRPWDVDVPLGALHAFAVLSDPRSPTAIALAQRWSRVAPQGPMEEQAVLDRAAVLEAEGEVMAGIDLLSRQLAVDPNNPLLHLRRGVLYAEANSYLRAERDFRLAVLEAPESPEPWRNLARLYALLHESEKEQHARAEAQRLANG